MTHIYNLQMKLSTINWLSKAIALPLFITIINIANSVSAEQIARSRKLVDSLPSVTDLNLMVPVRVEILSPEDREQYSSIEPFWSKPSQNTSTTVIKERSGKTRLTIRRKNKSLATINTSLGAERQVNKTKAIHRNKVLTSTRIAPDRFTIVKDSQKLKSSSRKLAVGSRLPLSGNYLMLVKDPSKGNNDIGNPIYSLEAYVNGQRHQTFNVVSGTVNTQNVDRNIGNNSAPLPDGLYEVSNQIISGTLPEVGKTFIGIFPKFETGRNSLGIHLDPSFNQSNGYDGTAGCIGMTTATDRDAINEFVTKYRPRNLVVKIDSLEDS